MARGINRRSFLFVFVGVWVFAVGVGLTMLWNYELSPGIAATASPKWPVDSNLARVTGLPTLIVLLHPHCPCSRATIGELAILMAQSQGRVAAYVLFTRPADFPDDWEHTDLWRSAKAIPGVTVLTDTDGVEARRFGSVTSGQTLLYSKTGDLLFSGGITASRGHSGDNAGRDAIASLLLNGASDRKSTFVYGCELVRKNLTSDKGVCDGSHK